MTLDDFMVRPAFFRRFLVRITSHFCAALLVPLVTSGCGTDAERTYAGLSNERIELDPGGYVLRYLAPPWQSVPEDPLANGARKSVKIGGQSYPVYAESGAVLEIPQQAHVEDTDGESVPKYRLESALVVCAQEDTGDQSCAAYLAGLDYDARNEDGAFDLFGDEPRQHSNDAGQKYYEMMGQSDATGRFQRVVFIEGADAPERVAGWLSIEANPNLGEREVSEMVDAFEMLPGTGAQP